MMLTPLGFKSSASFSPLQSLGTLLITTLALNTLENAPKAEAWTTWGVLCGVGTIVKTGAVEGGAGLGWCIGKTLDVLGTGLSHGGRVLTNENVAKLADTISNYATFKYMADKCFDAALLTNPQFVIPFRIAMTTGSIGLELYACSSAAQNYANCLNQQVDVFKSCTEAKMSWVNSQHTRDQESLEKRINSLEKCASMTDATAKQLCFEAVGDAFNKDADKTKAENPPDFSSCFDSAPSCNTLWLSRDASCAALGGHTVLATGRVAWEVLLAAGKSSIPPSAKVFVEAADFATKVI